MSPEMCLFVPVNIADTTLYFLWDTGAVNSKINKGIADKLNIQTIDEKSIVNLYQQHSKIVMRHTETIELKLGETYIACPLLVSDIQGSLNLDGIIGQDIIKKYYWLFYLAENQAVISETPYMPNYEQYVESFHMNFTYGRFDLPYCDIKLDDTVSIPVVFDSGMAGITFNEELGYDLFIMARDSTDKVSSFYRSLIKPIRIQIDFPGIFPNSMTEGLIVDSIKLNDKMLRKILILYNRDDYYSESVCFISAHFMKRYSVLYYDPFLKQISLYRVASDTTVNDEPRAYNYVRSELGYE